MQIFIGLLAPIRSNSVLKMAQARRNFDRYLKDQLGFALKSCWILILKFAEWAQVLDDFMRQKSLVTFRKTKWNRFSNIMGTFSPGNSTCTTTEDKGVLPRKTLSQASSAISLVKPLVSEFSIQLDTSWPSKIIRIIIQAKIFQMSFRIVSHYNHRLI